jgi:hypothetical protein
VIRNDVGQASRHAQKLRQGAWTPGSSDEWQGSVQSRQVLVNHSYRAPLRQSNQA